MTAGHCLQALDDAIKDRDVTNLECALIDEPIKNPKYKESIPFPIESCERVALGNEMGADYGIIPLSQMFRALLEKNDKIALGEEVWESQPENASTHLLFGVPSCSVQIDSWRDNRRVVAYEYRGLGIKLLEQKPDYITAKWPGRYYGIVAGNDDIDGMSGGPVFAVRKVSEENRDVYTYWIIGVQSSWHRNARVVEVCPILELGETLREAIAEYKKLQKSTGT